MGQDERDDAVSGRPDTPDRVAALPLDVRSAAYLEAHRRLTERLGVALS